MVIGTDVFLGVLLLLVGHALPDLHDLSELVPFDYLLAEGYVLHNQQFVGLFSVPQFVIGFPFIFAAPDLQLLDLILKLMSAVQVVISLLLELQLELGEIEVPFDFPLLLLDLVEVELFFHGTPQFVLGWTVGSGLPIVELQLQFVPAGLESLYDPFMFPVGDLEFLDVVLQFLDTVLLVLVLGDQLLHLCGGLGTCCLFLCRRSCSCRSRPSSRLSCLSTGSQVELWWLLGLVVCVGASLQDCQLKKSLVLSS